VAEMREQQARLHDEQVGGLFIFRMVNPMA
jgi:hypothetical protein